MPQYHGAALVIGSLHFLGAMLRLIVIVMVADLILEFIERQSKAKRTRAPASSRATHGIRLIDHRRPEGERRTYLLDFGFILLKLLIILVVALKSYGAVKIL